MSDGLDIPVCAQCGLAAFPPHLACSHCGSMSWDSVVALTGVADEITVLRRTVGSDPEAPAIALGSVRTQAGPTVIARLDLEVRAHDEVELAVKRGVIRARIARTRSGLRSSG